MRIERWTALFTTVVLLILPTATLNGQEGDWDASRVGASRAELQELLDRYEDVARSQAYSESVRAEGRSQAAAIRARLERGDFRVGDRVLLSVRDEPELSDTFVVAPGTLLDLPLIGQVSLRGVLRSELESYLADRLGELIHDPVVRARAMIRISILGEVSEPGFYLFPVELPLADALMVIGGPTQKANLTETKVEREDELVWEGQKLHTAIVEGRTLEELRLRTGDRIFVAAQPEEDAGNTLTQILLGVVSAGTIAAFTRIF